MKNTPLLLKILLVSLISTDTTAQNIFSARNSGLGDVGVVLDDAQTVSENPAQNTAITIPVASVSIQNMYGSAGLNSMSFSFSLPVKKLQSFSIHYSRIGTKIFYNQEVLLSYGIKISPKLNIGAQIERRNNSYATETNPILSAWSATIGFSASPLRGLILGASVSNPTNAKWNNSQRTEVPSILRIGTCISLSTKTFLLSEVKKETKQSTAYAMGIEYKPIDQLQLRTGIKTDPFRSSFGAGLAWKKTNIDFSLTVNSYLGLSPGISIQQKFR